MPIRRQSNESSQIVLLALVFAVVVVIFHVRENAQEESLNKIAQMLDYQPASKDDPKPPGIIQRLVKIETATVETAEIEKPVIQPKPRAVKTRKFKPKKQALVYADGVDAGSFAGYPR
jgi:hypothetical protein